MPKHGHRQVLRVLQGQDQVTLDRSDDRRPAKALGRVVHPGHEILMPRAPGIAVQVHHAPVRAGKFGRVL